MRLQYGATKADIAKARDGAMLQLDPNNKSDKAKADAVGKLVDAFLKDDSISDVARVDVSVSSSDNGFSVNVTINSPFIVNYPTEVSESKPHTEAHDKAKIAANATTNTIVEREPAEEVKTTETK